MVLPTLISAAVTPTVSAARRRRGIAGPAARAAAMPASSERRCVILVVLPCLRAVRAWSDRASGSAGRDAHRRLAGRQSIRRGEHARPWGAGLTRHASAPPSLSCGPAACPRRDQPPTVLHALSPGRLLGARPDDPARHAGVAAHRRKGSGSRRSAPGTRFVHQRRFTAL